MIIYSILWKATDGMIPEHYNGPHVVTLLSFMYYVCIVLKILIKGYILISNENFIRIPDQLEPHIL